MTVCCGRDEAELTRRAAAIGRPLDELRTNAAAGTPEEVVEMLAGYGEIGAGRMYLQVLDVTDLNQIRLLAAEVLPHVP